MATEDIHRALPATKWFPPLPYCVRILVLILCHQSVPTVRHFSKTLPSGGTDLCSSVSLLAIACQPVTNTQSVHPSIPPAPSFGAAVPEDRHLERLCMNIKDKKGFCDYDFCRLSQLSPEANLPSARPEQPFRCTGRRTAHLGGDTKGTVRSPPTELASQENGPRFPQGRDEMMQEKSGMAAHRGASRTKEEVFHKAHVWWPRTRCEDSRFHWGDSPELTQGTKN